MATNKGEVMVFWPDLSRFGARLSVAYNPSLGYNLLKLSILNADQVMAESGLPETSDFMALARAQGFALDARELDREIRDYRLELENDGVPPEQARERGAQRERQRAYFYSPMVVVNRDMLKALFPAMVEGDFRQQTVRDVKHLDTKTVELGVVERLVAKHMAFTEGEPVGVLFTTPGDRRVLTDLQGKVRSITGLLGLDGITPLSIDNPSTEVIRAMLPSAAAQRLLHGTTVLSDGEPLRAIRSDAVVLGVASRAEAILLNGGSEDGIERIELPAGLPIAFSYPDRRMLVVKDARFLEYFNSYRGVLPWADVKDLRTVAETFRGLDVLRSAKSAWTALNEAGLLKPESGSLADLLECIPALERIRDEVQQAAEAAGHGRYGLGVSLASSSIATGRKQVTALFGEAFCEFLDAYPDLIAVAIQRRDALLADAEVARGVQNALSRVEQQGNDSAKLRREDAGEKIGGARKDYHMTWLQRDEIGDMTPGEWLDVVTKENVWPALDYKAMQRAGVAPEVAWAIREFRSALPTNPYRGGYNVKRHSLKNRAERDLTQDQCENFVRAVSLVRDALANVQTFDEFRCAVRAIREEAGINIYHHDGRYYKSSASSWSDSQWFSDGAGYAFCIRTLPDVYIKDGEVAEEWSFDKLAALARTKSDNSWDWAIKEKGARKRPETEKEDKPEPEYAHLETIERVGPDYRQGKDADETLLMDVFGFRGVEYGNWLPQGERQQVLNHAFDAFMDLAVAMRLPPKALGLGGALAVAFGARGRGGKGAARAHFEPGRIVINLTRLTGAGALAHEWFHGFDLVLSKAVGASQMRYLSEFSGKRLARDVPLVSSFFKVLKAAQSRILTREEVRNKALHVTVGGEGSMHVVKHVRDNMTMWLLSIERRMPEALQAGAFRTFSEQLLARHFTAVTDPELAAGGLVRFEDPEGFKEALGCFVDRYAPNVVSVAHDDYPRRVSTYLDRVGVRVRNVMDDYIPGRHVDDTRLFADAKYFDSFRSKPYWSTPVEMAARAFEAWMQDRVEGVPGHKSQYLVYGRKPSESVDYSGWPRGADRERIAEALDQFFADHRPELIRLLKAEEPRVVREPDVVPA